MAVRYYEPKSAGAELQPQADPKVFVKADLEAELAEILILQGFDVAVRERLAGCTGYQDLQSYDDFLESERWRLKDLIDFFDYTEDSINITKKDGAWFSPIAIEDFCAERVGDEAVNAIDGNTATFWQDNTEHTHQITFQLRDYPKKISKIRIYIGTNVRAQLDDITIQVANSVPGLDDPNNEHLTNFTPSWVVDSWNEIVFTTKATGRYIRLTGFGSANSLNQVRIREIEAWVETQNYD